MVMVSPWERQRDHWLLNSVTSEELLEVIRQYVLDRPQDTETVIWLSSRGCEGYDLGGTLTEEVAIKWGGYRPRPSEVRYDNTAEDF